MTTPSSPQDFFDVRKIRQLVALMTDHDLCEMDIQQGDVRIQLRRAGHVLSGPVMAPPMVAVAPQPVVRAADAPAAETPAPKDEGRFPVIKSPMVGTFYAASDPDSPPYVKVGDHVGPETTVCIVEAMKVFNQIPAELSGKIVAVLVENGQPVEFGQPLFRLDPAG
jgi:acetyl-CoA carboxylase biotin carboxyl carrier protein